MEYLTHSWHYPSPDSAQAVEGDVGIIEAYEPCADNQGTVFLIVLFGEDQDYEVLAKCADKFLAHKIREACEKELDRVKIQEEDLDCSLKAKNDYGINYCLNDNCPYLSACPHFLP